MSTGSHRYVLAGAAPAAEIERLERVDAYMGPISERHLLALGLTAGWQCLEVGAGIGGVARFMAERVGVSGRVVATDVAPLFVADPNMPQLEICRHDIMAEGIDSSAFDLVHCRLLLANVGDVKLALQRMFRAMKPGGWLLVEEPGDGRLPAVGEATPEVAEFNALMAGFLDAVESTRTVDLKLYRRLPLLLEELGLVHLGGEHTQRLVDADGRGAVLGTLQALRPILAATPFVTSGGLDRLHELCAHPSLVTMGGSTVSMWGQRA